MLYPKQNPNPKPYRTKHARGAKRTGRVSALLRVRAAHTPADSIYGGPRAAADVPSRVTVHTVRAKYARGEPLSCVTAYDYPSAAHVDAAGIDMLLVGDSVGMVVLGHDTTLPVTLDEMVSHCRAVARGARRPLLIGDLPFGSYEASAEQAVGAAVRLLKEGGMDAVKMEGGGARRVEAARAISDAGVAVMGHVGLTPQAISSIGGFRPTGRSARAAMDVVREARALEAAGCFALVLECVPASVGAAVTAAVGVPTIGIGAGGATSGQVLVYHDLLGMLSHPHHAKEYRDDVASGAFPGPRYSPYKIAPEESAALAAALREEGLAEAAEAAEAGAAQQ
eukprot:PRCOL_00005166-RA